MFEAVITHQRYCYQFTCIVYHSAVNVYNVKTISYNYKFGITIIKGEEHNCITKLKKNFYSMLKNRTAFFFLYLRRLYLEFQSYRSSLTQKTFPQMYILFKNQHVLDKRCILAGTFSLRKWRIS